MSGIELTGLDGSNPLAYFAALGCLAALTRERPDSHAMLSWIDSRVLAHPVLHANGLDADDLFAALDTDRIAWESAPALTFDDLDDVKLDAAQQRRYLLACRNADDGGRSAQLASALIAEGTFAGKGNGKPTDLHFTAGQQKFLIIARRLQASVCTDHLREAVLGPWAYRHTSRQFSTFGWDVVDDRVYAYGFSDPSTTDKQLVPGADWLALMGLAAFPVRGRDHQAMPPGASGSWKHGRFAWGLWSEPLDWDSACALIRTGMPVDRVASFHAGVFRIYRARIRRRDLGGQGSFSPTLVAWDSTMFGGVA